MKKLPLTPAQRKQAQRDRDREILKSMGIPSLEVIMRSIRKMTNEDRKKLSLIFGVFTR